MKKALHLAIALNLIFTIYSCDPCLGDGKLCTDIYSFKIVDKTTHKDLVFATNPIYNRDSIYLRSDIKGYNQNMVSINNSKFTSRFANPVDLSYLKLSTTDTDTINIKFDFSHNNCCPGNGYGRIKEIKYNGVTATKEGDVYLFEK